MGTMGTRARNPKIDAWLGRATKWPQELAKLRRILLASGLAEELKWGKPCYVLDGGNVVIMLPLKEHCALVFFKGALLKDPQRLLVRPGENTHAARQVRFTSAREIGDKEAALRSLVRQAIDVEKAGLKAAPGNRPKLAIPVELKSRFDAMPRLKVAFEGLTPGRQRAYLIHFSAAKQSQTRATRIEKATPSILAGKGLNDDFVASRPGRGSKSRNER